jgi:hypothetical protein
MVTSDSQSSIPLCLIGPGLWSSCLKRGKCVFWKEVSIVLSAATTKQCCNNRFSCTCKPVGGNLASHECGGNNLLTERSECSVWSSWSGIHVLLISRHQTLFRHPDVLHLWDVSLEKVMLKGSLCRLSRPAYILWYFFYLEFHAWHKHLLEPIFSMSAPPMPLSMCGFSYSKLVCTWGMQRCFLLTP